MRQVIATLLMGALSSAAMADSPIVSAFATSRTGSHERVLSEEQVQVLDAWVNEHRKRWRVNVATPPTEALSIRIKHSDGTVRSIRFFDQPGWSSSVIIDGRIASFSATDIASLRQKLGESNGE